MIRIILQILFLVFITAIIGFFLVSIFNQSLLSENLSLMETVSSLSSLFGIVISICLSCRLLDHRKIHDYGFHLDRSWWTDFGFGLILGACLMAAIFLVELSAGWIDIQATFTSQDEQLTFSTGLVLSLILFISIGIQEEFLFRGYQLRNIAEGLNRPLLGKSIALVLAWVLSSFLFGLLHLGNPNASLISTMNIILAGIFLGLGFVLTGELAIPIGLHISWNFFQGMIFGFPVSGLTPFVSVFRISQSGPFLWTGGAFGPEAGLIGIMAMVAGSVMILQWVRYVHGRLGLKITLADYKKIPE